MKTPYRLLLSMLLIMGAVWNVDAQDIHFSQIGKSQLNLNPALTGVFAGDIRFTGNYKNQWSAVPVEYQTFSLAIDRSFYTKNYEKRFFSGGLLFNYDEAGDGQLSLTNIGLSGSYTHRIAAAHYLTLGGMGTMSQRSVNYGNFRFDRQYDTESMKYNPNFGTGEGFDANNKLLFDISAGLNWHYHAPTTTKRTNFDVGLGILHFNQPNKSFVEEDADKLPLRLNVYAFSEIQLTERLDLLAHGVFQDQGPHRQTEIGIGAQFYLNPKYDEELAVSVGMSWRADDSVVPVIGLRHRMLRVGLSYDINTDFQEATDGRGGFELSASYVLSSVKPLAAKVCPVYL